MDGADVDAAIGRSAERGCDEGSLPLCHGARLGQTPRAQLSVALGWVRKREIIGGMWPGRAHDAGWRCPGVESWLLDADRRRS